MSDVRLLDDQLLEMLEERWRARGAQTPDIMEPGLSDAQIDDISAPLGFPLPDELRTLYRWHNGSGLHDMAWARGLWALDLSVSACIEYQRDRSEYWRPGWIQILSERPYVLADCLANDRHGPVPIWNYDVAWEPPTRPSFASVGDMVACWIDLIDDDLMYWDGEYWQIHDDRAPEHVLEALTGMPHD